MIHFLIKGSGVQDLVFVKITFEKCTTNFYFENSEDTIKTTIANLQPSLALNVFMQPCFQEKRVLCNYQCFLSRVLDVFP